MSEHVFTPIKGSPEVNDVTVKFSDDEVSNLNTLVKLSKLPRETYEGKHRQLGVTSAWMRDAKDKWENNFDWRATEAKLNALPQWTTKVDEMTIHFVGIRSAHADAVPILLLHGWPGSFYEFYPLMHELRKSTTPHFTIIAPSLPGYMFSSPPPTDRDYTQGDVVTLLHRFMAQLGVGPYIAMGSDMGAQAARGLTAHEACRGCHLTMFLPHAAARCAVAELPPHEAEGLQRGKLWIEKSRAYSMMHATRPSTIGHVLASSPLALLAWIAEKFLEWTDDDPDVGLVLEMASLWWLAGCYPTSIYPYRQLMNQTEAWREEFKIRKPFGFSWFPKEVTPQPRAWIEGEGDMVFFKTHEKGGHFPAFEKPVELAEDIVEFARALDVREKEKA